MGDGHKYHIEPLDTTRHRREEFDCGVDPLTRFLRQQARKEAESKTCACFVAVTRDDPGRIAGYYTLSAATMALVEVPPELFKRLPRYPHLPVTLLGRLARDLRFRGTGVGPVLLIDALARALRASGEVGSVAVVTDPKDIAAQRFYERFGFRKLSETRMILSMADVEKLIGPQATND